jgi:nicotinamidase/pyrazinamidase
MLGGALPVEGGDQIIGGINQIARFFEEKGGSIILTQDWHPKTHKSFASNHLGKQPGDEYQTEAIGPVLWPDHCVQDTSGANFHKSLDIVYARAIIRKGMNPEIDSYSGFLENDKKTETGLAGLLKSLKIERIFICGLALDYCCYFTAIDGMNFGFEVFFIMDLTKGIDFPNGNISQALNTMKRKNIKFANIKSFITE